MVQVQLDSWVLILKAAWVRTREWVPECLESQTLTEALAVRDERGHLPHLRQLELSSVSFQDGCLVPKV